MVKWLPLKRVLAMFSARYADSVALDRSATLHKKGAYREAYALLRGVLDRHPDWRFGDAYVHCAWLELMVNDDLSKTGELFDTALRLGCRDMATYYAASGCVFWRAGECERGIREMEKAVDMEPSVFNLGLLGDALSFDGDARAADILKRVLEQEPLDFHAHVALGVLAAKTGDREKALLLVKRAQELHPSACDLTRIAWLHSDMGEFRTALATYAQANRQGHAFTWSDYAGIATCHFELGNLHEGWRYLEEGRCRFPNSNTLKRTEDFYKDRCPKDRTG